MTSSTDNVVETGFGAQFGDGSLLDFVGDCIESAAVVGGDGEGGHGGAAENSGCRMGVVAPEGCTSGRARGRAEEAICKGRRTGDRSGVTTQATRRNLPGRSGKFSRPVETPPGCWGRRTDRWPALV
jgi:hypothetical protein